MFVVYMLYFLYMLEFQFFRSVVCFFRSVAGSRPCLTKICNILFCILICLWLLQAVASMASVTTENCPSSKREGVCSVCSRVCRLFSDGRAVYRHGQHGAPCRGSGKPPVIAPGHALDHANSSQGSVHTISQLARAS